MTGLLFVVGTFVFFISVGGAILVGGHLLAELDEATTDPPTDPRTDPVDDAVTRDVDAAPSDLTSLDERPVLVTAAGRR